MRKFSIFFLFSLLLLSAALKCPSRKIVLYQGQAVRLKFYLQGINPEEVKGLSFSYHLYDRKGKIFRYENPRFSFVARNTSLSVTVFFPAPPGEYQAEFELLKEGRFWGRERGWKPCRIYVRIKDLLSPDFQRDFSGEYLPLKEPLWNRFQHLLRLTFANSEIKKGQALFGFSPGSNYPQLWIRDLATAMDYAKFHYPLSSLEAMVELFLRFQHQDGEISDWISPDYRWGKNTVSSDQESSLVLAAYSVAKKNPRWLCKTLRGRKIIDRLALALKWLWDNRRSRSFGLIWSGFKADWGDVSLEHPADPVHYRKGDLRVVGIYTQAKFYQALKAFLEMKKKCPPQVSFPAEAISRRVKENSLKYLYLKDKGYFLIHRVLGHPEYLSIERNILATGGNAEAILAGFLTPQQGIRFFRILEKRLKEFSLRSPGFTLLPPYPPGFFKFHLMKPWHYQNGGDWDWIGGRVIRAMIRSGLKKEARFGLEYLAKRSLRDMCIYEWRDKEGKETRPMFYTGAAGQLGKALVSLYRSDLTGRVKFVRIRRKNKE